MLESSWGERRRPGEPPPIPKDAGVPREKQSETDRLLGKADMLIERILNVSQATERLEKMIDRLNASDNTADNRKVIENLRDLLGSAKEEWAQNRQARSNFIDEVTEAKLERGIVGGDGKVVEAKLRNAIESVANNWEIPMIKLERGLSDMYNRLTELQLECATELSKKTSQTVAEAGGLQEKFQAMVWALNNEKKRLADINRKLVMDIGTYNELAEFYAKIKDGEESLGSESRRTARHDQNSQSNEIGIAV